MTTIGDISIEGLYLLGTASLSLASKV